MCLKQPEGRLELWIQGTTDRKAGPAVGRLQQSRRTQSAEQTPTAEEKLGFDVLELGLDRLPVLVFVTCCLSLLRCCCNVCHLLSVHNVF